MFYSYIALALFIVCMVVVQVLYKYAGLHLQQHHELWSAWVYNPALIAALIMLAVGMVLWLLTLRNLPLTRAYPWTAAIYIITPLVSIIVFGESLKLEYYMGMVLIVIGIMLTTKGAKVRAGNELD